MAIWRELHSGKTSSVKVVIEFFRRSKYTSKFQKGDKNAKKFKYERY